MKVHFSEPAVDPCECFKMLAYEHYGALREKAARLYAQPPTNNKTIRHVTVFRRAAEKHETYDPRLVLRAKCDVSDFICESIP